jgi:hypothetical protein
MITLTHNRALQAAMQEYGRHITAGEGSTKAVERAIEIYNYVIKESHTKEEDYPLNPVADKEIEFDDENVYFITTKEYLPTDTYERLKARIDETWPKDKRRPILLENCSVVKL